MENQANGFDAVPGCEAAFRRRRPPTPATEVAAAPATTTSAESLTRESASALQRAPASKNSLSFISRSGLKARTIGASTHEYELSPVGAKARYPAVSTVTARIPIHIRI